MEDIVDIYICGTKGTLRLCEKKGGEKRLYGASKGSDKLEQIMIKDEDRGMWRVEEEFINAIRGKEDISHTDFSTAVKYMEWTDAVTKSLKTGHVIQLPLI
jgi:hypothetical protein